MASSSLGGRAGTAAARGDPPFRARRPEPAGSAGRPLGRTRAGGSRRTRHPQPLRPPAPGPPLTGPRQGSAQAPGQPGNGGTAGPPRLTCGDPPPGPGPQQSRQAPPPTRRRRHAARPRLTPRRSTAGACRWRHGAGRAGTAARGPAPPPAAATSRSRTHVTLTPLLPPSRLPQAAAGTPLPSGTPPLPSRPPVRLMAPPAPLTTPRIPSGPAVPLTAPRSPQGPAPLPSRAPRCPQGPLVPLRALCSPQGRPAPLTAPRIPSWAPDPAPRIPSRPPAPAPRPDRRARGLVPGCARRPVLMAWGGPPATSLSYPGNHFSSFTTFPFPWTPPATAAIWCPLISCRIRSPRAGFVLQTSCSA